MSPLSDETERRAFAFIRIISNKCSTCFRGNKENCPKCSSFWAKKIINEYDRDKANPLAEDCSIGARVKEIMGVLKNARSPLRSRDIHLSCQCSRELKRWTLKRMVKVGLIKRTTEKTMNGVEYVYYVQQDEGAQ